MMILLKGILWRLGACLHLILRHRFLDTWIEMLQKSRPYKIQNRAPIATQVDKIEGKRLLLALFCEEGSSLYHVTYPYHMPYIDTHDWSYTDVLEQKWQNMMMPYVAQSFSKALLT